MNFTVIFPELTSGNFNNWKFRVKTFLDEKQVAGALEKEVDDYGSDKEKEEFRIKDAKAKSIIIQCITDKHLDIVKDSNGGVVTRGIVSEYGFGSQGLFKGVTATIWRNGVFNMIYFGFYHSVKDWLPEYKDSLQEFLRKVSIGFVSGTLASCVNIPFDVAKSRIQGPQPVPGQIKYRGTFRSLAIVYREEGYLALYKGLLPKVMRLGPGGAIMLVVYDYVHCYLTATFM